MKENKKYEKTDGKKLLIGTLLITIVIMSIGYAALAQQLNINGTAEISGTWNVAITDIAMKEKTGNATEKTTASHTATTATFDVALTAPGDSMTFDVTVTNAGNLDAILDSIVVTPEENGSPAIRYTVTGVTEKVTTLNHGSTNVVTVKVQWDPSATSMPAVLSKTVAVTLNYVQK